MLQDLLPEATLKQTLIRVIGDPSRCRWPQLNQLHVRHIAQKNQIAKE